jgi:alkylation response protein AidB-like acyl-CoA dehydrogenase
MRWLAPIVRGEVRSAFAMTEPAPGGGSDPGMIRTTATRRSDGYVIHGRKWFITGAGESKHFIVMARTSDDPRKGLTAFLFHADQPGWKIERRIPIMGPEEHGGHCEITFDGLEVSDDNILMGVGDGLKMTQIRLGPARLTHCMRWTGMGRRALEIAMARIEQRHAFGQKLAEKESVQMMVGEAAMQLDISRLVTMRAAWKLDQGDFARKEVSTAKIIAADALHRAADTACRRIGGCHREDSWRGIGRTTAAAAAPTADAQGTGTIKIGDAAAGGDFVTAPEISPLFAQALAAQLAPLFAQVPAAVVEFGAGTGQLAAELMAQWERAVRQTVAV